MEWQDEEERLQQEAEEDEADRGFEMHDLDSSDDDEMPDVGPTFKIRDFIANQTKSLPEQLRPFTTPNCTFDLEEERKGSHAGVEWVVDILHHIDYILLKGAFEKQCHPLLIQPLADRVRSVWPKQVLLAPTSPRLLLKVPTRWGVSS